jgi:hypothetical protein
MMKDLAANIQRGVAREQVVSAVAETIGRSG